MTSIIPSTSGIYRITCTTTNKHYIGSSINLRTRWQCHASKLRCGTHHSIALQRAWNKYGEESFTFEVIELVLTPFLLEREQYWFDQYKPFGNKGYNILSVAGSCLGVKASIETRTKLSAARIGNTNSRGKIASPETRQLLSITHAGKKHTIEHRKNVALSKTGKKRSPETVEKMRQGRTNTKFLIVTSPDGIEQTIYGIRQFCKEHGLDRSNLMHVAKGNKMSHKGWKARFPED